MASLRTCIGRAVGPAGRRRGGRWRWIWVLLTVGIVLNGLRLRDRLARIPSLALYQTFHSSIDSMMRLRLRRLAATPSAMAATSVMKLSSLSTCAKNFARSSSQLSKY